MLKYQQYCCKKLQFTTGKSCWCTCTIAASFTTAFHHPNGYLMTPADPVPGRLLRRRQLMRAGLAAALPLAVPALARGTAAALVMDLADAEIAHDERLLLRH
jgi:hypothetical protein